MSIRVACACGKQFNVKQEFAGKRGKCPGCGQLLTVPTPPTATASEKAPSPVVKTCPRCQETLQPNAVICLNCGHDLRTWKQLPSVKSDAPTPAPEPVADSQPRATPATSPYRRCGPSGFWRCPGCRSVLQKKTALMGLAKGTTMVGTVTCGVCQQSYACADIYGGTYDLIEVELVCPHCSTHLRGPEVDLLGKPCPACDRQLPGRTESRGEVTPRAPTAVARGLAAKAGLEFFDATYLSLPPSIRDVLTEIGPAMFRQHAFLPFAKGENSFQVLVSDPHDSDGLFKLAFILGAKVEPVVSTREQILDAIDRFYGLNTKEERLDAAFRSHGYAAPTENLQTALARANAAPWTRRQCVNEMCVGLAIGAIFLLMAFLLPLRGFWLWVLVIIGGFFLIYGLLSAWWAIQSGKKQDPRQ